MAFDFPNGPSNGQIAIGPGGISYTWDGAKWASSSAGGVAYAPINSPVFTGDPQAPTAAITDADNSIASTAFVQAVAAPIANNSGRNLVTNGTFTVAQRGAGTFTSVNAYTADRWQMNFNFDTLVFAVNTLADGDRAQIGDEAAQTCLGNSCTGTAGAGAFSEVVQKIENVRRLAGKAVTVSFWASASTALKLGVSLDQNMGTGGSPSASVSGNGIAFQLTTSWARYSATFTLLSLSGKTLGANGDHNTQLNFWFSSGATQALRAGSIGVQTGNFNLWGVQLEIGSVATKLDYGGSPQQVLAECQRFYCATGSFIAAVGTAGQSIGSLVYFPVTMRAAPSVAFVGPGLTNCTALSSTQVGVLSAIVYATTTVNGTAQINTVVTASADL